MKNLYIFVNNGGDGSYYPQFTFCEAFIDECAKVAEDHWHAVCESMAGCDGDGFHFETLTVPDECTIESLGCKYDASEGYDYKTGTRKPFEPGDVYKRYEIDPNGESDEDEDD